MQATTTMRSKAGIASQPDFVTLNRCRYIIAINELYA
jgi:hypothetical protein